MPEPSRHSGYRVLWRRRRAAEAPRSGAQTTVATTKAHRGNAVPMRFGANHSARPRCVLPSGWPDDTLAQSRDRRHALIQEALNALTFISFSRVQIALRINRNAVHAVEFARQSPAIAE